MTYEEYNVQKALGKNAKTEEEAPLKFELDEEFTEKARTTSIEDVRSISPKAPFNWSK